jgi:hypothetical protein
MRLQPSSKEFSRSNPLGLAIVPAPQQAMHFTWADGGFDVVQELVIGLCPLCSSGERAVDQYNYCLCACSTHSFHQQGPAQELAAEGAEEIKQHA